MLKVLNYGAASRRITLKNHRTNKIRYALVDARDYADLSRFRWHLTSDGYAARREYRPWPKSWRNIRMHRHLLNPRPDEDVDHVNANRLDNRRCNIRKCSRSENTCNSVISSRSKSGYKGITLQVKTGRWVARVSRDGRRYTLGAFDSKREAARAYIEAAKRLHGEFFCRRIRNA